MRWTLTARLINLTAIAGVATLGFANFQAGAATKISVKTSFYSVRGSTPGSIVAYMIRNGPHGESGRAMGTTSAKISQHVDLQTRGKVCAVRRHRIDVAIVMRVPKLASGQKLSASNRKLFNDLASYVRAHENHHKTIFIGCAKRIDQKVSAVRRNQPCSAVRAQIKRIFNAENQRCNAIHSAYDKREAVRVRNLPFIRKASAPRAPVRRKTTRQTNTQRRTTSLVAEQARK